MSWPTSIRAFASVLGATVVGLGWLTATSAQAASSVSSNWAGYVAVPSAKLGPSFTSVSGTWAAGWTGQSEARRARR